MQRAAELLQRCAAPVLSWAGRIQVDTFHGPNAHGSLQKCGVKRVPDPPWLTYRERRGRGGGGGRCRGRGGGREGDSSGEGGREGEHASRTVDGTIRRIGGSQGA